MEMDYWRQSVRVSRRDRIRNDTVKQKKKKIKNSTVEDISIKQLIWWHIMRMSKERLPSMAYEMSGFHQGGGREEDHGQQGRWYPGSNGNQALKRVAMVEPSRLVFSSLCHI